MHNLHHHSVSTVYSFNLYTRIAQEVIVGCNTNGFFEVSFVPVPAETSTQNTQQWGRISFTENYEIKCRNFSELRLNRWCFSKNLDVRSDFIRSLWAYPTKAAIRDRKNVLKLKGTGYSYVETKKFSCCLSDKDEFDDLQSTVQEIELHISVHRYGAVITSDFNATSLHWRMRLIPN